MCLDAHAHGMRVDHEIFNTPNKVELTITDLATPTNYAAYPEGRTLGKTMPMWRVQTEGYLTHPGQLVGIVSRDKGFLDSPDTEWISGGVNMKGPNAVALGRHGNFLHWGFAASPTYMTDEAKDVFVNALHYIAKFAGRTPIVRKEQGILTRHYVDHAVESVSEEGYARTVARYAAFAEDDKKRKADIQKRLDAGEEVTPRERQLLQMKPPKVPGRLNQAQRLVSPEVIQRLGKDPERVSAYLRENRPYFRPNGWASLRIDEDLKSIGVGSDDIALLDRLVVTMLAGDGNGTAKTLLERYTDQSFATAQEWARWLETNRSRLFFTEAGGYRWLVDTIGSKPKPTAPNSREAGERQVRATPDSPLASGLSVRPLGKGRYELTLHVDVLDGFHAYDRVPDNSPYKPLRIELDLPKGVRRLADWEKPKAQASIEDPGLTLFEGRLAFRCEVESAKAVKLTCRVSYQVCDAKMCMVPTEVKHTVTLGP